jgi:DNA primase small subunit
MDNEYIISSNNNLDLDIEDLANLQMDIEPTENNTSGKAVSNPVSRQNLELYYGNIFPFKQFFKWLGLAAFDIFERREFSFTLENDIYVRFQSFRNDQEFKKEVMRGLPIKIDIGAIYNTQPKYHNSIISNKTDSKNFIPVQKEMVFDIDMTDYDDVRTCCKDAKICDKCWKFMIIAYKILNVILTDDFGFDNIQWIFSGRRGIHCWVSDERARNLNNEGRSAIASYIRFKTVNSNTGVKVSLKEPIHPSLE